VPASRAYWKNFSSINQTAEYARLLKITERALNEVTRQAFGCCQNVVRVILDDLM
jgi:hypothetical protein